MNKFAKEFVPGFIRETMFDSFNDFEGEDPDLLEIDAMLDELINNEAMRLAKEEVGLAMDDEDEHLLDEFNVMIDEDEFEEFDFSELEFETEETPVHVPEPKLCRHGLQCHGRKNGKCPFTHPPEPTSTVSKLCRHGLQCHGRKNGKCPFIHSTEPN